MRCLALLTGLVLALGALGGCGSTQFVKNGAELATYGGLVAAKAPLADAQVVQTVSGAAADALTAGEDPAQVDQEILAALQNQLSPAVAGLLVTAYNGIEEALGFYEGANPSAAVALSYAEAAAGGVNLGATDYITVISNPAKAALIKQRLKTLKPLPAGTPFQKALAKRQAALRKPPQ